MEGRRGEEEDSPGSSSRQWGPQEEARPKWPRCPVAGHRQLHQGRLSLPWRIIPTAHGGVEKRDFGFSSLYPSTDSLQTPKILKPVLLEMNQRCNTAVPSIEAIIL
ncbi:hypothetical protein DR999_PMT07529 [Platysternon megacephalum]|uniref:Uncharacterized protein n=1 Tax=Platysternon megacephalum TaxID=55544 RepID=A0A4D9EHE3_9SAUR|nr:hypothetical protein DR999_PMT07529 [Platysternon megacephalum]